MIETSNNIIFYVGYVATISALLAVIFYSLASVLEFLSRRKSIASFIFDIMVNTHLKGVSDDQLNAWFDRIKEKHARVNDRV